jgi:excinuclease UvrABC ATPase subunit
MDKPKYESMRGLSPTIAIEQKSASKNPRSTVGTITEVYDYLRVFYARLGTQYCYKCHKIVGRGDAAGMVQQIADFAEGTKIVLMAPVIEHRKGSHKEVLEMVRAQGYQRVRVNGTIVSLDEVQDLQKHKKHSIDISWTCSRVSDWVSVSMLGTDKRWIGSPQSQAIRVGRVASPARRTVAQITSRSNQPNFPRSIASFVHAIRCIE